MSDELAKKYPLSDEHIAKLAEFFALLAKFDMEDKQKEKLRQHAND